VPGVDEHGDGRRRLLDAAAELFAEHGSEGVSLRQINERAGMRNASASQYHFGDRAGLIRALIAEHQPEVDAGRHALLDVYEARSPEGFYDLADALVRPFAPKLASRTGGRGYLQVCVDLLNSPKPVFPIGMSDHTHDSMERWLRYVAPLLSDDDRRLHMRFTAYRFTMTELARRSRSGHAGRDDRLFVSHLVDLVTGLLAAPLSDETLRLDAERPPPTPAPPAAHDDLSPAHDLAGG
jgi:AcrR family transcriptional regulator